MSSPKEPLVRAEQVSVWHRESGRALVSDVSFTLYPGRCLGIVGESGSGKTLLCRALMGLLPPVLHATGKFFFGSMDMLRLGHEEARRLRGTGMSAILQQAMTAFDPLYTIGAQFRETLQEKLFLGRAKAEDLGRASLASVKLPANVWNKYPHQLSGGMLQRCMIALTLAFQAHLVVADEPTTALDAQNQYGVLQRFARLRRERGMSLIFISHDLGAVQMLADSVLVMHRGRCVESGPAEAVFNAPQHECTRYLVRTRLALTHGFERILGGGHGAA